MAGLVQHNSDSRWSLQHFRASIRKYLVALSQSHAALRDLYVSLFQEDLTIQPIDCKEVIDALKELLELVQECNNRLTDSSLVPLAALAPRYRLLFASQLVREQTLKLIDLLNSYRVLCLQPSQQAERTRKKIQEVFQVVLKSIPDIPRQALYLEEEAKLMEQELIAALHEKYA